MTPTRMQGNLTFSTKHTKSYKTYDNAVKAAMKFSEGGKLTFVVLAGSGENEGKFTPVFIGADANHVMFQGFGWIVKG